MKIIADRLPVWHSLLTPEQRSPVEIWEEGSKRTVKKQITSRMKPSL